MDLGVHEPGGPFRTIFHGFFPDRRDPPHGIGLEVSASAGALMPRPRIPIMFRPFTAFPALLLAVAIGAAAPACASGYYQRYPNQRDSRDVERLAYDNGYRQGFPRGERDALDRRGYRIDRDGDYRNADGGYRGYGDRDGYRRAYRNGYEAGYAEGYNRVARSVRNDRGRIYPPAAGPGGRNVYVSPAAQTGYRDGYEAGRDDARDRRGNDPRRSKRYREGDNDYNGRYGSRDQYKQEYRAAFQQGYDQGYRESRR
jgi:hypothetical protein